MSQSRWLTLLWLLYYSAMGRLNQKTPDRSDTQAKGKGLKLPQHEFQWLGTNDHDLAPIQGERAHQGEITIGGKAAGERLKVMTESDGKFRILGLPVNWTSKCSALGDVGDIVLADLNFYGICMMGGITIADSAHAKFDYDEHCFRATAYIDGNSLLNKVHTGIYGTQTYSPFVTLAARA